MKLKDFRWSTGVFLILSPLGAAAALAWYFYYDAFQWQTVTWAVFMAFATGMGITVGYHRLFSHKSYEAAAPIRWLLTFFGAGALEKSVIEWSHDHRNHHRFVDTDQDPYSINKGFFHAHIGWLFVKRGTNGRAKVDINQVKDLWADPFIRFQHNYYTAFGLFVCFLFPGLVALAWGDFWGGVLIAGLVRVVVVHHGTFCINSICHSIGQQPYSSRHTARDSWISALFTFGEGYHNYHHEYPADYRNGIRAWQYDPSKWMIWTLSKLGLASNLIRMPDEKILESKLEMKASRVDSAHRSGLEANMEEFSRVASELKQTRKAYMKARKEKAPATADLEKTLKRNRKALLAAYKSQKSRIRMAGRSAVSAA